MCWVCDIENLKAQIAKEDINVYKVVTKAIKKSCVSPFMIHTYYLKNTSPSLTLGVLIKSCSNLARITEGYYSDSSEGIVKFKKKDITYENVEDALKLGKNCKSIIINESNASKLVALSKLMNIAKYYNGDWKPDWNNKYELKYCISFTTITNSYNIASRAQIYLDAIYFKNMKDVQSVIDNPNFRDILDAIYKN